MISTEELARLIEAATPDKLKIRKSEMDEGDWEIYPTRGGRKPTIDGAAWAEIATVTSDNENHPGRAKANAQGMALWKDLAAEVIRLRAQVAAAEVLRNEVEDVTHGRGMFGLNAGDDLDWALGHLEAALAAWSASQ